MIRPGGKTEKRIKQILWYFPKGNYSTNFGVRLPIKLRKVTSPDLRRRLYRQLRHDGVYALLWNNATETAQRRRIARAWLKSWMV